MKKNLFIAGALLLAVIGSAFMASTNEITSLEIGAKAPMADAKMKNIDKLTQDQVYADPLRKL